MAKLRPPMNSNQRVVDQIGNIDPIFYQYHRSLHDVVTKIAAVPADAGAWPATAAEVTEGAVVLWRNGSALRFYANVSGTLRYVAFT